jgi:MFS family permease
MPNRTLPYQWISRDARLMITARFLRTFAQASIAVFFGIYLIELGYSLVEMGLLVTLGSLGSAFFATTVVFIGTIFGRRQMLIGFSLMTAVAGLGFAFTDHYVLLGLISFFVGSLAISGSGPRGPVQPLETASMPDTTTPDHRTELFAIAGIVERAARLLGTLAAALPPVLVAVFDLEELTGFKVMFVGYTVIMLVSAGMYTLVSPAVEVSSAKRVWQNPLKLPSRRKIFTLAAIFSMDSTGTRFIFFSLVAAWFNLKFGLDLAEVSLVLVGSTLLNMVSLWVAVKIANRIGLLNTVVFTHIPAVIFTLAVPFAPNVWLAVLFWYGRAFFSQMDNPARQSYTMAIVNREERIAMASVTNLSQASVGAAAPVLTTYLWQTVSASVPFLASGLLKTVYLVSLYLSFRNVHPPEEEELAERREQARSRE